MRRLSILITNTVLNGFSGTEIVARDLANGLARRGHQVGVYCPSPGAVADIIRQEGVPVVDDLNALPFVPEVIHGHHHVETLTALERFPEARGIFVCHDRTAWTDLTPYHPRLTRYVAVDFNCRERLELEGKIPREAIAVIPNAVDLTRFVRRAELPPAPRGALVFSNYARAETHLPAILEACARIGLHVDVAGSGVGKLAREPEKLLPQYELVFAKARCACEALATGCAVILCDFAGLGSLVRRQDVETFRDWNFGRRLLTQPIRTELILAEIERYDASDAAAVTEWIREHAGLEAALDSYQQLYEEVLQAAPAHGWPLYRECLAGGLQRIASLEKEWARIAHSPAMPPLSAELAERISLKIEEPGPVLSMEPDAPFEITVGIENRAAIMLSSTGPTPLRLGYHWLSDAPGADVVWDGERTDWDTAIESCEMRKVRLRGFTPKVPGSYRLQITLVQETRCWIEDLAPSLPQSIPVKIARRAATSIPDGVFPMPVIVGCPRSGTTLLRLMLDAHPQLAIPPETGFLPSVAAVRMEPEEARRVFYETVTHFPADAPAWKDFHLSADDFRQALERIQPFSVAEGCRTFYRLYAQGKDKPRWGEKTPVYCLHVGAIAELLPEAHFLHIIRDGRDVAVSLREQWFAPGKDMESLAQHWRDCVLTARAQGASCAHYLEVRYESLVTNSRAVLEEICRFIDLPFHSNMEQHDRFAAERLQEHLTRRRTDGTIVVSQDQRLVQQQMSQRLPDPQRIGSWKTRLTAREVEAFESVAGDLLEALGYR